MPENHLKVEVIGYDNIPSRNMYSTPLGDNGASSSKTDIRLSLIGMGFLPYQVDKAIREKGEDNLDLLLETLFAYSSLQNPKPELLDSTDGFLNDTGVDLSASIHKSNSEDSLDSLFKDDETLDGNITFATDTNPKEEPDDDVINDSVTNDNLTNDIHFDKKASLLMMNFSVDEVQHAMSTLGEDTPVNELVDFIFAAQIAGKCEKSTDQQNPSGQPRNEDVNTEALFGTMSKTLRLLEMGFSESEISAAIEKYGSEVPFAELADSIVIDQLAGTSSDSKKSSSGSHSPNVYPFNSPTIKTENYWEDSVSQLRDSNLMERYNSKRPIEENRNASVNMKKPKQEYEDVLSSSEPVPLWLQARQGTYKGRSRGSPSAILFQRRLKHKSVMQTGLAKQPNLSKPHSCRSLDRMVAKAPYFLYGNVTNLSQDSWVKISQFMYCIEPEFANTQYFSALNRKEGYVHNIPTENRTHILPKSPMTIEEAIPRSKKYWPPWDTRKQLTCISSETSGISVLCERLARMLIDSRGILSAEQQKNIYHQCRTLNLVWLGHNRLGPIEPEQLERILGYPVSHTQVDGLSLTERLQSLKQCFQTDTLGYHISPLKTLFPNGIRVLSINSGIGGAEITLHRLGIRLIGVVSIEPSEVKRSILKKWWENCGQSGELIQMDKIEKLTCSKVESLMNKFGGFDFIVFQNPHTSSVVDCDSLAGFDMSVFCESVRVIQIVRGLMEKRR